MYRRRHLDLLRELAVAQARNRDQSTLLGILWSFLHPLLLLVVLYSFFSNLFATEIENYGVYLLIGLVHYTHFANTTGAALRTLGQMRELTAETVFPKELLVLSHIAASSVEFLVSTGVYLGIAALAGVPISATWLWVGVTLVLQLVLSTWVGLILAGLYPFLADIDHLYQIFLRMLFFATPVFYEASSLSGEVAQTVIRANPLAWLAAFSRGAVMTGRIDYGSALVFLLINAVLVGVALKFFRALEPRFAEHV